jgi:exodeoxyribonuclease-3
LAGERVRVLTWNIMHGGGADRLPRIGLALLGWSADVIAITEFRVARGGSLRGVLADHGWAHQTVSEGGRDENRVFVASRTPIVGVDRHEGLRAGLRRRLVSVALAGGTRVTAAHVPDAQRSDRDAMGARTAVWGEIVAGARRWRVGGHIVLGDLNTGRHRLDEAGASFSCTAMLGRLASLGYVDAWRSVHGVGARQASWRSHAGAGFRLDHALVSAPLAGAIRGAEYGQIALKNRLSDHAPLVVELADAA